MIHDVRLNGHQRSGEWCPSQVCQSVDNENDEVILTKIRLYSCAL
jgi:hypothetical protein